MTHSRRLFALLFVLVCLRGTALAQRAEELTPGRVLGPQWKQLSRAAGLVFAGTVLRVEASPSEASQSVPTVRITFRVDQPIVGIEPDQELTIREWAGAWANHRPMRVGEHLLLFLYPPSQLGLTSPVGGQAGQFRLDSQGGITVPAPVISPRVLPLPQAVQTPAPPTRPRSTVRQLARTIRRAREE